MSGDFWIYWVVAIPVTAVTVTLWYLWQHHVDNVETRGKLKKKTKNPIARGSQRV